MSMHCQFCRLQNQSIPNPGPIHRQSVVDPAHRTSVQGKFFLPILYQSDADAVPIPFQSIANPKQICQANENPGLVCQSIFNGVPIHCQSNVNPIHHQSIANLTPIRCPSIKCQSCVNPIERQSDACPVPIVTNLMLSIACQSNFDAFPILCQSVPNSMSIQCQSNDSQFSRTFANPISIRRQFSNPVPI